MNSISHKARRCACDQLHPDLLQAIQSYFESHQLGEMDFGSLVCCETVTEKNDGWISAGLKKGASPIIYSVVVLSSDTLVWGQSGGPRGTHLVGAKLKNIHVKVHHSLFSGEAGLEVKGLVEDSRRVVEGVIVIGTGEESEAFCKEVCDAVEKINPSPTRKWSTWLGGH